MPSTVIVFLAPPLLFISFPLFIFAIITTALATVTLFLRVLLVYSDLAVAVLQNSISYSSPISIPPPQRPLLSKQKYQRSVAPSRSSSTSGSLTPKLPPSSPYPESSLTRDFEGVGGWRFPGPNDADEDSWTGMNARLEIPITASVATNGDSIEKRTNHKRSMTSGALSLHRPLLLGSKIKKRPVSAVPTGTVSPDETFIGESWTEKKPSRYEMI